MKQVKILDEVHLMLIDIVRIKKEKGNLGTNKQSVVNELIMAEHKKATKQSNSAIMRNYKGVIHD